MDAKPERLGEPDLKVSSFQLWVHGRQFPDSDDYWDGNWLTVTAHCAASGARVSVFGALLMVTDIVGFGAACEKLRSGELTTATLDPLEPEIKIVLRASDALGHIEVIAEITPDQLTQYHRFEFSIDQSFLPGISQQCAFIADRYPVRGEEQRSGA